MLASPSNTGPGRPNNLLLYVVPRTSVTTLPSEGPCTSDHIPKLPQFAQNGGIQFRPLLHLFQELHRQALHLVRERLVIIVFFHRSDVAAGREHESILSNFFECGAVTEARLVGVLGAIGEVRAAPAVVGLRDARELLVGKFLLLA